MTRINPNVFHRISWFLSKNAGTGIKSVSQYFGNEARKKKWKRLVSLPASALSVILTLFIAFYLFVFAAPLIQELFVSKASLNPDDSGINTNEQLKKAISLSEKELAALNRRYEALTPRQPYLVINTSDNHFFLYKERVLIREGFVSTGSNVRLQSHDDREWLFQTPKGKRTVKGKITSPVWRRPDWAFIEEGLPVPSANHQSRFEAGVLGDYALSLGDGYLIHGTLYKRFLGMPVTHGCVRLNDEDLEFIYKSLNVGSRVYIY